MKLFDYEVIYLAARGNPRQIVELFLQWKQGGTSWVKSPQGVKSCIGRYSYLHIAEYIGLCSLRPLGSNTTLPISQLPPWVPKEILEGNPLIKVDDGLIHFLEEK